MDLNTHPALEQGAMDVPVSSPDEGNAPAPDQGGSPDGSPETSDGKSGRTPDNVRGELLRKMEKDNAGLREQLAELKGMLANGVRSTPPPPAQPDVASMTAGQLEALRSQVPADKLEEFEKLVAQRRIDEQVTNTVDARLRVQTSQQQRVEANKVAYTRWPELHDRSSQLYKTANQVLNEKGNDAMADPRALLDASNEAGLRLGLQAKRGSLPSAYVNGSAPAHDDATRRKTVLSKERASEIAQKLQQALPPGKKFDLDRVAKSDADYREHQNLITRSSGRS